MLSTTLNSQTPTVRSKISSLTSAIDQLSISLFAPTCGTQFEINSQIPSWILNESEIRQRDGYGSVTIFDFIQKYYDWLYCDGIDGAQYKLSEKLIDLIDVEKTPDDFLEKLAFSYADGFQVESLEQNGGFVKEEDLRQLIKNIRTAVYQKKTTEDGIRYFFTRLFGVDEDSINIEVPKKIILRLNGGRFVDDNFTFPGGTGSYESIGTLSGSYLNGSRMQDSNWIQDWSYLLKVGIIFSKYKETYVNMMHPAGLKVVFEKTLADYQGPTYDETIPFVCEYPLLKNYSSYGISFDYQNYNVDLAPEIFNQIWITDTPPGITLCGLSYDIRCSVGNTGFCGPTHIFPSWTTQTDVFNFRGININTMLELCYPAELGSPNDGVECS